MSLVLNCKLFREDTNREMLAITDKKLKDLVLISDRFNVTKLASDLMTKNYLKYNFLSKFINDKGNYICPFK